MDVTVVVGTFGAQEWVTLAQERAIPSALAQDVPVIHRHADTLAQARNAALNLVRTPLVVHLDADDELEPGYCQHMHDEAGDVGVPRVATWRRGRPRGAPFMPNVWSHHHDCDADCLRFGSWIVVGAAIRTHMALALGGWREYPCYEDFDLFQRLWLAGAQFVRVPDAIYRQHLRPGSRNHSMPQHAMNAVHEQIDRANGVSRDEGWVHPLAVA